MSANVCAPAFGNGFLMDVYTYVECQSRWLASIGVFGLSGSPMVQQILFVALSFAIAFFGLRMMRSRSVDLHDSITLTARIAIVLALVTSWPAFKTLFHDTFFDGPDAISGQLVGSESAPQPLIIRYQELDRGIVSLTAHGTGRNNLSATLDAEGQLAAAQFFGQGVADEFAFGAGRFLMLLSALVGLAGLTLLGSLLLVMMPFAALCLLHSGTQHLFTGWLKSFALLIVAATLASVILVSEVRLAEAWMAETLSQRVAGIATPSAPIELMLMAAFFAVAMIATLILTLRLSSASQRFVANIEQLNGMNSSPDRVLPSRAMAPAMGSIELRREHHLASIVSRQRTLVTASTIAGTKVQPAGVASVTASNGMLPAVRQNRNSSRSTRKRDSST